MLSKNRLAHQGGAEVDALGARAERILLCLGGLEGNLHLRQERLCALPIIITCATGSLNAIPFTTLIFSLDGHIGVDEQVSSLISIGGVERDCHHLFARLEHIARKAQGGSGAIARKFAAGNGRGFGLAQTHLHSGVQRFSKCLAHVECEGGDVTTCLKACVSQVVGGIYHLRLSAVCVHVITIERHIIIRSSTIGNGHGIDSRAGQCHFKTTCIPTVHGERGLIGAGRRGIIGHVDGCLLASGKRRRHIVAAKRCRQATQRRSESIKTSVPDSERQRLACARSQFAKGKGLGTHHSRIVLFFASSVLNENSRKKILNAFGTCSAVGRRGALCTKEPGVI